MVIESPGNITTTVGLFDWVNSLSNNFFFPGILTAFYIIILIKMLTNPANTLSKSFAAASFSIMVLTIMARSINLVSTSFMSLFIIATALSAVWMHFENVGG